VLKAGCVQLRGDWNILSSIVIQRERKHPVVAQGNVACHLEPAANPFEAKLLSMSPV
jgi:hypothetical protein